VRMLRSPRPGGWLLLLALGSAFWFPGPVRAGSRAELTRLVDAPTAGMVDKGQFGLDLRFFGGGGVMAQFNAGVFRRLMIGVSYGGQGVIGDSDIVWYPRLEAGIRYRLMEENQVWPALVIGYETQGYGPYADERYQVGAKEIFLSMSKNYLSGLGQFGLHGGLNLTRDSQQGEGGLSGWVGADKSLNEELALVGEYDLGLGQGEGLDSERGYLNVGAHWALAPQLKIGFFLKNLLLNGEAASVNRELTVLYCEEF
jgi:hypothetical protein